MMLAALALALALVIAPSLRSLGLALIEGAILRAFVDIGRRRGGPLTA
jgi:hypothetical protein